MLAESSFVLSQSTRLTDRRLCHSNTARAYCTAVRNWNGSCRCHAVIHEAPSRRHETICAHVRLGQMLSAETSRQKSGKPIVWCPFVAVLCPIKQTMMPFHETLTDSKHEDFIEVIRSKNKSLSTQCNDVFFVSMVFTALQYSRAVLLWQSRLSVKRVDCDKTKELPANILIPYETSMHLVFWHEEALHHGLSAIAELLVNIFTICASATFLR